ELIAAYVVGMLRGEDRGKFENDFLSSEGRTRKLEFAKAWYEKSGSNCSDLTSRLHRFILGDLGPAAACEVEQKPLFDGRYREQLAAAVDDLLMAYFEDTLTRYERELFEVNYFINDRVVSRLRFAHIMREYVKGASAVTSLVAEKAAADRRRQASP